MSAAMFWILGAAFLMGLVILAREVYFFLHWKQSLGRFEEHEWNRHMAAIRQSGPEKY